MRQNYPPGDALGKEFYTKKNVARPATPAIGNKILSKNTFRRHHCYKSFDLRGHLTSTDLLHVLVYGGRGLARFKLKTWQCDELSAGRSMNSLVDGPANCSAEDGMFDRRQPLPPKKPALGRPLPSKSTLRCYKSSTHGLTCP